MFAQWTVAASSEPTSNADQPTAAEKIAELSRNAADGTTTSPPATIPDQPTLAPQRAPADPAPATSALSPEDGSSSGPTTEAESVRSARTGTGSSSLEVILREGPSEQQEQASQDSSEDEPLAPIPDPRQFGPVEIQTASFNGVIPGETTLSELQQNWGTSSKVAKRGDTLVYLYAIEPFDKVEVSCFEDTVTSIVIRLDQSFPAKIVAEQLDLSNIRPVLVSNPLGEILGQAFPERGVLFAFTPSQQPGKPTMEVTDIILEPVSAEPFVLRAETYLEKQLEASIADLEQAIELEPTNARAHWLKARASAAKADQAGALAESEEAVRLRPNDPQYRVTRAQILAQAQRSAEAVAEARKALATSQQRPHVKARALCLLGDLYGSGPEPDFKQAIDHHMQAIDVAEPIAENQHPAVRLAAKEVLIDAHLGAAHDIAWGNWNQKEVAVPRWLSQAFALADQLIEHGSRADEHRFRVAARALAAYVGLEGRLDPTQWTEETIRAADKLIASAQKPARRQQIQRELGVALYDAVQVYQMRGQHDAALKFGQQAVEHLRQVTDGQENATADTYLLGRLYFRLGAIHAIGKQDHQEAIEWFEKATAVFDKSVALLETRELGRLGESLVSMGVSYWESGQQEKAVELTQRGVALIEKAVTSGAVNKSALEIPSGNLAAMQRVLSQGKKRGEIAQKPGKDTALK